MRRGKMSEVTLAPVDPTPEEVQYLEDRIYEFNSGATGIADGELLAFFVREGDRVVAGICGNTWGGTCELRQIWVEESQRHRGLGTRRLQAAQQEASPPSRSFGDRAREQALRAPDQHHDHDRVDDERSELRHVIFARDVA